MSRRLISPVLVGRDAELRDAVGGLRRAAAGRPSVIVLAGEAGIGKTRLAEAIARRAAKDGFRVLAGSCIPVSAGTLTYGPVTQVLRALALDVAPDELQALVGDDGALLARILPALGGPRASRAVAPPVGASKTLLLEALFNLVRRVAAEAPVLLVVDDLQWADPESLDVLAHLARSFRDERVAILLTVRTEDLAVRAGLAGWLAEIERLVVVDPMELRGLDRALTDRLVHAILGWSPDAAVLDEIHARSGGNPFFVEELLQPGRDHTLTTSIVPSLRVILDHRVRAVPPGTWRVLALLAVARRDLDDGLLAELAGLPEAELAAALDDGTERGLLAVEHDGTGDRCRLRHALIGEAVYDRLFAPERRRLHGQLALGLEQRVAANGGVAGASTSWAEVAGHWDAAGDVEQALPAWCRAAGDAEHGFAFRAALDCYQRALAAWDAAADPERLTGDRRLALLGRAGWAAFLAAAPGGDVPLRRLAVEEADRLGDPEAGAVARADLGFSLWAAGEPAEAEAMYREAAGMVPAEPPSAARAHVLAVLGQVLMNTGRHRQALTLCDEAIGIARALGERRLEANASDTRGVALAYLGRSLEAIEALEGARSMAAELGDAEEVGRAFLNESEILVLGGQPRRALALAREGIEVCSRMGTWLSIGQYISLHGAVAAYELGDWASAAQLAEAGHVGSKAANDELYYLAHIVELAVGRGDWEDADRHLRRMAELIRTYPAELQYTGPHATASSELALWRHDPDGALRVIGEALDRLERTDDRLYRIRLLRLGTRAAADLAEVERARRKPDAGRHATGTAVALRARVADALDHVAAMDGGARDVAEADLLGTAAEWGRLEGVPLPDAWQAAARAWADLEHPYLVAYARWREAEAWLRAGNRAEALTVLDDASTIADGLGAVPLAREITGLARRSRLVIGASPGPATTADRPATSPRPARQAAFDLTPRELDVLELLRDGRTDRQIAEALFISPHTVGVHVSRILGKLGASSRTEAAAIAYRLEIAGRGDDPPE